jgi:hypothetical protein
MQVERKEQGEEHPVSNLRGKFLVRDEHMQVNITI